MSKKTNDKQDIVPTVLPAEKSKDGKSNNDLTILNNILSNDLVESQTLPSVQDPLAQYIREISRYKLLSSEEEQQLLTELELTGDVEVAKKLVLANLRLVVKIAMEYRSAWQNVMDLIQEGNIGLMKAVSKYDSSKGAKLSYYASWWIKSYILKFIKQDCVDLQKFLTPNNFSNRILRKIFTRPG